MAIKVSSAHSALFVWLTAMAAAFGLFLLSVVPPAHAATPPVTVQLGTASTYSVLAGSAITNTLTTKLSGDLGVSPGTAVTGFPPGIASGETHIGTTPAALAQQDVRAAYTDAKGRIPTETISGDIAGSRFTSGVYAAASALDVSADGIVTLDAQDDPNAVFIFQIGSALGMGARSNVRLINSAQACNVFWQVGSSATLGASSSFSGTILANAAVTVGAGTSVIGRVLMQTAATLSDNDFTTKNCQAAPDGGDVTGVDGAGAAAAGGSVDGASAAGAGATGGSVDGAIGVGGGTGGANVVGGVIGVGGGTGADSHPTGSTSALPGTGASSLLGPLFALGLSLLIMGGLSLVLERDRARSRRLQQSE